MRVRWHPTYENRPVNNSRSVRQRTDEAVADVHS
jgi:hypothetical protein